MRYLACNHIPTGAMNESQPWLFTPLQEITDHIRNDKKARQLWIQNPHTEWNYWTFHVGKNKAQRVSKANYPLMSYGFAADIDHPQAFDKALDLIGGLPFKPRFIERTLSRKGCRFVFEFERPVNMGNFGLAELMNKEFAKQLGVDSLPGYDTKSADPCMVWSNGAEWHDVEDSAPIPSHIVFDWQTKVMSQWRTTDKHGVEVPLDIAYKLCKEKFGDKFSWPTDHFELEQQGPTWFVEGSESQKSAVIKAHGIYSFSDHASERPFRSWDDPSLLGDLVKEYKQINLEEAVRDVYFDGRAYFSRNSVTGEWAADSKDVFARKLKVEHRLSGDKGKGQRSSEVEQALHHVESNQRVSYATAMLCVRPGLITKHGKQIFNYAQPVIVEPCERRVETWGDGFPFIAKFLDTVWEDVPSDAGIQKQRFLMLAKRLYESFIDYQPRRHAAVFLVGPRNIGKTFMTTGLLGTMLGGSNDPTSTLVDGNRFNADMLDTPVWSLDDPQGKLNNPDAFSDMLKRFVANPEIRSEQKFVQGGMGAFNGIVCVTMNDDAKSLKFMPEVDRSNCDKWHFFKLKQSEVQFTKSEDGNQKILQTEMPQFVRWLVDWQIPAELEQRFKPVPRWGHETYMHPALLTASLDGSMKMSYKTVLMRAIAQLASEKNNPKEIRTDTVSLMRTMNQVAYGARMNVSPKNIDRFMAEFAEEDWPVKRERNDHGLTFWVITDTTFFKGMHDDAA